MKIRTARKILNCNPNGHLNMHRFMRFKKLRPSYINAKGEEIFPSWHDIDIVRRARERIIKWRKNR